MTLRELNFAVLPKFMWFLVSKFAKKCKFTRLVAVNILTFAVFCQAPVAHWACMTASVYHMHKIPANFSNAFNL
ncbi:hypothetical protein [Campylobacter concisus]